MPQRESVSAGDEPIYWEKKGKYYLDLPGWMRLREEAGSRWRALATDEARAPIDPKTLVQVKVGPSLPVIRDRAVVRVSILEPAGNGEVRVQELLPNEDGLFDITNLGIA